MATIGKKAVTLFNDVLFGKGFYVTSIRAIYNPILLRNFVNYWTVTSYRFQHNKSVFFQRDEEWNDTQLKCYERYLERAQSSFWNSEIPLPILAVLHGTDFLLAEKIAQVGFANLSALDAGYYGKGIYFSSYAEYILPYFISKKNLPLLSLTFAPEIFIRFIKVTRVRNRYWVQQ